ncbi:MAG: hypothetical protein H6607_10975 [Flavobacteriales bacterium]|nr:hypothetical protein [Flavobacteriales bacterium]
MLLEKKIPLSYIFNKVKYEMLLVALIGLATYYITLAYRSVIPDMPIAIPAFIGTAISVLLSFKLNQSYDRWWEARKVWGAIVNDSRSLVLQLQMFLAEGNKESIRRISFRHIAWLYSLTQSLRKLPNMENLEEFLSAEDMEAIKKHNNKPLALMQLNAKELADLKNKNQMDSFSLIQINNTLVEFSNHMGKCERIKNTVFPTTYRKFLHWTIYLFTVTLSISLRDIESYFELPLLLAISSAFFLLERSATHMQDPFDNKPTDTPMTTISRNIEINLKQLLGEKDIPKPITSSDFYSL